ncbi:ferroxidase [Malassezia brasiliensis]|uniref:ferroxidase n=1 Tax=Malassezia brasiliensis TaxID=1821822 RepID=A0AAF0IP61_9BASI|nr:ferroxidase [Malassezia brasiliensis]
MTTRRAISAAALRAARARAPLSAVARTAYPVLPSVGASPTVCVRVRRYTSAPAYTAADLTAQDYNRRVDASLDALTEQLEELIETEDIDEIERTRGSGGSLSDWDVEYATGVLNLRLGSLGTYVINKQPPSRQIWLSSPTSGPKRFDYDAEKDVWFTYKDGQLYLLHELLDAELSAVFGKPLTVEL